MKLPRPLVVKLSPLVEAASGRPLVEPALEVVEHNTSRVVVVSDHGRFCFDLERRVVVQDEQDLTDFAAIQSIELGAFPGGRGERSWSISLYLGFWKRIMVGRTYDDGDASVVAAKLSRATGAKVVATVLLR